MTLGIESKNDVPPGGFAFALISATVFALPTFVPGDYAGWTLRIWCVLLTIVGLKDHRDWMTGDASRIWIRCVIALLISYALSTISARALGTGALDTAITEDFKVSIYYALSIGLTAACANPRVRRVVILTVIFSGFAVAGFSALMLLSYTGFSLTFDDVRAAKFILLDRYGLAFNSTVHIGILGLILLSALNVSNIVKFGCAVLFVGLAIITAARTPLGALALSIFFLGGKWVFDRSTNKQRIYFAVILTTLPILYVLFLDTQTILKLAIAIDSVLAGRAELWLAAAQAFLQSPIFGTGPGSWHIIVPLFVPKIATIFMGNIDAALTITSGGYHSMLVTALAERGITGLITVALSLFLILRIAFKIRANSIFFQDQTDQRIARIMPLLWLYISIRGLFEESGIFGRANADVDFIALILLGLTLCYGDNLNSVTNTHSAQNTSLPFAPPFPKQS